MTRTRTIIVIVVAISISVGLSLPLAAAYAGGSGGLGFFSGIMSRNVNHQQPTGYPGIMGSGSGYGGMMSGYYWGGAASAGSAYGHGMMMGEYYANGATSNHSGYGPGMKGSFYDGNYGEMMTIQGQSISIQQAVESSQDLPAYAQIIKSNNTISFHSQTVSIIALAMMPEKAVNITGSNLPSYASGDVYVIYGLINPTLVIPAGATVQFNIVNLDDDMYHNLVVSLTSPPYPYMAMQVMMYSYGQTGNVNNTSYPFASMMGFLPPANYDQGSAHEYSYTLTFSQSGTLWYLCTYPGHAQSGMYGQIIVA